MLQVVLWLNSLRVVTAARKAKVMGRIWQMKARWTGVASSMTRGVPLVTLSHQVAARMVSMSRWPLLVVPMTLVPRRLLLAAVVLVTLLEMKGLGMATPARWWRSLRTREWKCNATWTLSCFRSFSLLVLLVKAQAVFGMVVQISPQQTGIWSFFMARRHIWSSLCFYVSDLDNFRLLCSYRFFCFSCSTPSFCF